MELKDDTGDLIEWLKQEVLRNVETMNVLQKQVKHLKSENDELKRQLASEREHTASVLIKQQLNGD